MIELSGGFINGCYRNGAIVEKHYLSEINVGQSSENRKRRETIALKRHECAPSLVEVNGASIVQEFVSGDCLEGVEKDEGDFYQSGKYLSQIHTPVRRPFAYTREYYQKRWERHANKALFILNEEGLAPRFDPDWDKVEELGTTRVHRDFWMGNIIRSDDDYRVVDWEFSGIGSPYEDFAICNMWIFGEHGGQEAFWEGYGQTPDEESVRAFEIGKCVEFLSRISYGDYRNESKDGFYHDKVHILQELTTNKI